MWFNKKNKKQKFTSKQKTVWQQYHREVVAIIFAALFCITFIAVVSYSPYDSTFLSYSSRSNIITNFAGAFGANFAALLLYFLGTATYVLLAVLLVPAYVLLACDKQTRQRIRLAWLPLLVLAGAGLCNVNQFDISKSFPGGLIGYAMGQFLQSIIGYGGASIVLWAMLWIGIVVVTRISLATLMLKLAKVVMHSFVQVFWLLVSWSGKFCFWIGRSIKNYWHKRTIAPARQAPNEHPKVTEEMLYEAESNMLQKSGLDAHNQEFWDQVAQQPITYDTVPSYKKNDIDSSALEQNLERLQEKAKRFATKKITTTKLKNTVFKKNIFAVTQGQEDSPYVAVMRDVVKYTNTFQPFYQLPELTLFTPNDVAHKNKVTQEAKARGKLLEDKLQHFGVRGRVTAIQPGPVITMYEYQPDVNSKLSKITALEDDLAMALSAHSIRIIAPIPGKNAVGFEIANKTRQGVLFSQAITSDQFQQTKYRLPIALGVDVVGHPVVSDLATMPHLLVGGTTGSGKSVGLNSMIASLLCKRSPQDLRMILIDPKRLEFTPYADIPHLLFPIVTNPVKATGVLKWVVQEMEERYERMAAAGVRNIDEYKQMLATLSADQDTVFEPMPYITVIIDELADLMIVAGKDIETQIVRIAQMARAAGIHMIVATQRPSVDVVTGLIKVNFPSRAAFRVSSKVDSRTILDQQGAEKLLGRGDMLFMHSSSPHVARIHGAYVSDTEIQKLTDHLRSQQKPAYLNLQEVLRHEGSGAQELEDDLYPQVLDFLKDVDEISISSLQRRFSIGFNRSARIIEALEKNGAIAPAQGSKPRKVLI